MKTKTLLSILALGFIISAFSQNTIELTFTAIDSAAYVQLDSIKVMNRTQGSDTVIFYPDTVLVLDYQVGISEIYTGYERFQVFQNYPNPVIDKTTISFYVPERDKVSLIATDILGRELIKTEWILDQGYHSYHFTPGNGSLFLFTVQWRESSSSIKILQHNSVSNNTSTLEYIGSKESSLQLKTTKNIQSFLFSLGDKLLYIGYIDTLQSGMLDTPEASETNTFQFATNIPCLGTPTVIYAGQVYNTIQICNQCWLKENLNVGSVILGSQDMIDNGIIEKYCYDNDEDFCNVYGGLYQWSEMMQYINQQGTQGICPPNWHVPNDEEWKIMEGIMDSQYMIGDTIWNMSGYRGYDAGLSLKTTSGWVNDGNGTDLFGYSGLPGGGRLTDGNFDDDGYNGYWWTSSEINSNDAWSHLLYYINDNVNRYNADRDFGLSVRCVKNY